MFSFCFLESLILVDCVFPPHRWAGNVEAGWSGKDPLPSIWIALAKLFWRVGLCNGEGFWYISKWLILPSCWQSQEGIFRGSSACEPGSVPGCKVHKNVKTVAPRSFSLLCEFTLSLWQFVKMAFCVFLPVYDPSSAPGKQISSVSLWTDRTVSLDSRVSVSLTSSVTSWVQKIHWFFMLSNFFLV